MFAVRRTHSVGRACNHRPATFGMIATLVLAACTGAPSSATSSTGGSGSGGAPISTADASALLRSFDPAAATANYLIIHEDDPAVVAAAADALAAGAAGWEKWAATLVWANQGDSVAPLLSLLTDPDPTIRVMAAAGVLSRGGVDGFAPLIDALDDAAVLAGSEPPVTIWLFAATTLVALTGESANGPPFDADTGQQTTAKTRWTAWLAAHRATLRFDDVTAQWTW